MHPTLRQVPPSVSRLSTQAVFSPSCAPRIAATLPPCPKPLTITSTSVCVSAIPLPPCVPARAGTQSQHAVVKHVAPLRVHLLDYLALPAPLPLLHLQLAGAGL